MTKEEKGSSLAESDSLVATGCFPTVWYLGNVFVTLLPSTVETLKDHCVGQLSVSCFGGQLIV